MKKILCFLLMLMLALPLFAQNINTTPNPKWHNSLKPKGLAKTFNLVKDNKADCIIVKPWNATPPEEKSSADLAFYLSKMTGVEIPVLKDNEFKGGRFISVGNTSFFRVSPYAKISQKLEEEGLAIYGDENSLYLFGGSRRGPLYAVYTALEEDNDFRFWSQNRDEDYIPKSECLSFVPRYYNPVFETRDPYIVQSRDSEFVLRNKINNYDYGNTMIPKEYGGVLVSFSGLAHTSFNFLFTSYFDSHPEFFSMQGGERVRDQQICWSNKEALTIMANYIVELKKTNDFDSVNISPQDGYPLCDCPECRAFDKAHGDTKAASLINGLNYIADIIHKTYPDMRIITLAYLDYIKPPKGIRPDDKIIMVVCSDNPDWYYPLCTLDETEQFREVLKSWVDYGVKTLCWTYVVNYSHYLIPDPNLIVTAKNNKIIRDLGAGGIFMQGNYDTNSISDSGRMKAWVWSKLLWNPDLDPEALMKDFVYGYYGECAEPIYKYEKGLLDMWKKGHAKKHTPNVKQKTKDPWDLGGIRWTPDNDKLYTDKWVKDSMALMDKAMDMSKSDNMRERVQFERVSLVYLTLTRNLGYLYDARFIKTLDRVLTDQEVQYYASLIDEFEGLYKKIDCVTISETNPRVNLPLIVTNWKNVLTFDRSKYILQKIDEDGWKFILDSEGVGATEKYYLPDYDASKWQDIKIGVFWSEYGVANYLKDAWFKKSFEIDKDVLDKDFINIYFGSVDEEATIYINGEKVFSHTVEATGKPTSVLWCEPFAFNVKPYLKEGNNDITVMVSNPGGNAGGIYDKVLLVGSNEDISDMKTEIYGLL